MWSSHEDRPSQQVSSKLAHHGQFMNQHTPAGKKMAGGDSWYENSFLISIYEILGEVLISEALVMPQSKFSAFLSGYKI